MGPWRRVFQDWFLEMPDGMEGGERISAHLPQLLMDAAQCEGCFALLELKQPAIAVAGIYFLGQKAGVSGAPELSVFVLLLVVLLARPQGLFGKETA